jgi:hypothetical protein
VLSVDKTGGSWEARLDEAKRRIDEAKFMSLMIDSLGVNP